MEKEHIKSTTERIIEAKKGIGYSVTTSPTFVAELGGWHVHTRVTFLDGRVFEASCFRKEDPTSIFTALETADTASFGRALGKAGILVEGGLLTSDEVEGNNKEEPPINPKVEPKTVKTKTGKEITVDMNTGKVHSKLMEAKQEMMAGNKEGAKEKVSEIREMTDTKVEETPEEMKENYCPTKLYEGVTGIHDAMRGEQEVGNAHVTPEEVTTPEEKVIIPENETEQEHKVITNELFYIETDDIQDEAAKYLSKIEEKVEATAPDNVVNPQKIHIPSKMDSGGVSKRHLRRTDVKEFVLEIKQMGVTNIDIETFVSRSGWTAPEGVDIADGVANAFIRYAENEELSAFIIGF